MTCLTGGRTFVKVMFKPQRATQNRKMNTPRYLSVLPTAEWLQKKDGFGNGKSCILALPLAVCGSFECGGGGAGKMPGSIWSRETGGQESCL